MDDLTKSVSDATGGVATEAGLDPAALSGLQGAIQQEGGIDGLIAKMREGGLGPQVDSWESNGENQPLQPEQLQQALGPDTVQRLSSGSGIDIAKLLPLLVAFLPQIINMLTPDGKEPDGGLNQAAAQTDIGGMLGGLLGGDAGSSSGGLGGLVGSITGMLGGNKN
jgi:uncharacterized protein YidB (DUF937 family)